MIKLQPIIMVRELPPACSRQRQHLPSIRELIAPTPSVHAPAILSYLGQGVVCGIYNDRGMLYDVLRSGQRIESHTSGGNGNRTIQPNLVLTDGIWVWPGALLYYVAIYHIQLPERFLRDAESHQWRIDPSTIDLEELSWDAFDAIPSTEAR
ncbi:MAG TPA: hypothetical protein VG013_15215 [Gemmataceae bacterium]|nr:hypothetical protein [Gemmataceae bacterium]